jgi:hypothetical protein
MAEENPGNPKPPDEGIATSYHVKWGPLPPNYVGRIVLQVREQEGRAE